MRFKTFVSALALVFPGVVLGAAEQASSVAMVADLEGQITLDGDRKLHLLDEIVPGRILTLTRETRLVLVDLNTGDEKVFKGPGKLRFDAAGHALGLKPAETRKHPSLNGLRLRLGGLAQVALVMRSGHGSRTLEVLPKGPVVLESAPLFRWESLGTQATYQFKLFNAKGAVLLDRTQTETRLQAPELKSGEEFTWVLEACLPEQAPRICTGKLQVADASTRELLAKSKPAAEGTFTERLVFAALLEDAQIHDEARAAWKALAKERPEDARLKVLAEK